jgi:hypothetical protein
MPILVILGIGAASFFGWKLFEKADDTFDDLIVLSAIAALIFLVYKNRL